MSNDWTKARTVIVPAGTYWLSDPCYVVQDDEWDMVLDKSNYLQEKFEDERGVIVSFSTAYGDGLYLDQYGNKYPVDAGCIGLTDVRFNPKPDQKYVNLRQVIFDQPTVCSCTEGCTVLRFGNTEIDTDPQFIDFDGD